MPPAWTLTPEYISWVDGLRTMVEPETCMAYSLANAARMAGRAVNPKRLLELWDKRSICIPGSTPVTDPPRALRAASAYLKDVGIEVSMKEKASSSEFPGTFAHGPEKNVNPAHVITLGPGYMRAHHDAVGPRIPRRARRESFEGPGHDVLVLGMEGTDLLIHDPDPQLKPESRDARFEGAPVVCLDRAHYRNFFASGDHARTLTAVSQLLIKPKDKPAKRDKGQRRLLEDDE